MLLGYREILGEKNIALGNKVLDEFDPIRCAEVVEDDGAAKGVQRSQQLVTLRVDYNRRREAI